MRDLHELPKLRDGLSHLYLEHGKLERVDGSVAFFDAANGRTMLPVACLALLMLGPGTSISHAAMQVLAQSGCSVLWCGEQGVRLYAQGLGETRKAYRLLQQARLVSIPSEHMAVVLRMYRYRFGEELDAGLSLEQIRGLEGVRVRTAYAEASKATGVPWHGRFYDRANWNAGDPVNRALSAANACLNGLCHAAIVSAGYSPGLGFIHTGKQLSFVYDIADLYKVEMTVPLAFRIVAEGTTQVEARVRRACRDMFREKRLLDRIIPDIDNLLQIGPGEDDDDELGDVDADAAQPTPLWPSPVEDDDGGDDP